MNKEYFKQYYIAHRDSLLEKAKKKYARKRRKHKCKWCGYLLPATCHGNTKTCDKCISKESRQARWWRKKTLTKKEK